MLRFSINSSQLDDIRAISKTADKYMTFGIKNNKLVLAVEGILTIVTITNLDVATGECVIRISKSEAIELFNVGYYELNSNSDRDTWEFRNYSDENYTNIIFSYEIKKSLSLSLTNIYNLIYAENMTPINITSAIFEKDISSVIHKSERGLKIRNGYAYIQSKGMIIKKDLRDERLTELDMDKQVYKTIKDNFNQFSLFYRLNQSTCMMKNRNVMYIWREQYKTIDTDVIDKVIQVQPTIQFVIEMERNARALLINLKFKDYTDKSETVINFENKIITVDRDGIKIKIPFLYTLLKGEVKDELRFNSENLIHLFSDEKSVIGIYQRSFIMTTQELSVIIGIGG